VSAPKPSVPHVIVTGGPGAGKTTLLAELAAMGYRTVDDSARAIIADRRARGASPRPDPRAFAEEILRQDIEKYLAQPRASGWVFFDRGLIDALGMLQELSPLPSTDLESRLASYPFHSTVFVLPPWGDIYTNDAERDQSFADAVGVHARVVRWYRSCGYVIDEVPRLPLVRRAEHVLRVLGESDFRDPVNRLAAIAGRGDGRASRARDAAECIRRAGNFHWVGLYDVTPTEIRAIAWTGTTAPAFPAFPRTSGLNGAAVAEGRSLVINDVRRDRRYLTTFGGTLSEAIVPIRVDDRIVGTIDVESEHLNAFTSDDERFLEDCAAALAALWK
jgi:predicted ATPase/putative methionine-R-sulfoxide reductase with GAF domain